MPWGPTRDFRKKCKWLEEDLGRTQKIRVGLGASPLEPQDRRKISIIIYLAISAQQNLWNFCKVTYFFNVTWPISINSLKMFLTSGLCSPTQYHRMSILYSLFSPYCYQKIKIIYGQWIFSLIFSIIFQISINFNAYFWKIASNFTPLPFVKLRYDPRKSATNIWWTSLNQKILHKLLLLDNLRPDKSNYEIKVDNFRV